MIGSGNSMFKNSEETMMYCSELLKKFMIAGMPAVIGGKARLE